MYVPPAAPATVLGATAGTLAITGINALVLGLVASCLIVVGALLLRIAYLASNRPVARAAA